jgi:ankyrin repeat protein
MASQTPDVCYTNVSLPDGTQTFQPCTWSTSHEPLKFPYPDPERPHWTKEQSEVDYADPDRPYWTYIGSYGGRVDISLHIAAAKGDVVELGRLLDAGHDINARSADEDTALLSAVMGDQPSSARLLLKRGADAALRGAQGSDGQEDDAVQLAALYDRVEVMRALIESGVEIHAGALGFALEHRTMDMLQLLLASTTGDFADMPRTQAIGSVLRAAVHMWDLERVRYLMKELGYGEVTETPDADRSKALDVALLAVFNVEDVHDSLVDYVGKEDWGEAMKIIKLLVDAGASVSATDDWVTRTPLHFALQLRHPPLELLEYLLDHGADSNTPNWMGRTPVFQLLTHPESTEDLIKRFKNAGGNFDTKDEDDNTPLHLVRTHSMAKWLLDSGADPTATNKHGKAPLHLASNSGLLDVVTLLLEAGAPVDQPTSSSETPLMLSSLTHISEVLLQHGAHVNAATDHGWTALHRAASNANPDLTSFLLSKGADVRALASPGRYLTGADHGSSDQTPMHVAVAAHVAPYQASHVIGVVAALLAHGADIEAQDSDGMTPLLLAIATDGHREPSEEVVGFLLERADLRSQNKEGKNALRLAEGRGYHVNEEGRFERRPVAPTVHKQSSRGAVAGLMR